MARFDSESLLNKILEIMQVYLNAKIIEINTEKNDSIVLAQIDNNDYFFNHIPKDRNTSSFIVYSISNNTIVDNAGFDSLKDITIDLEIVLSGLTNVNRDNLERQLMRYTRAIEEVISDNWSKLGGYGKVIMQQIPSQTFLIEEGGDTFRVSGITCKVTTN